MIKEAKRIARLSLFTALGVIFLLLANILPSGRLVLLVLASFPVCAALMLYGKGWALGVYAATAILGCVIFPGSSAVAYVIFFGYYPVLKSVFERIHTRYLSVGLKCLTYAVSVLVYWRLALVLFAGGEVEFSLLLFLGGAGAFFVYDYAYSILIRFYIEKIARYFS